MSARIHVARMHDGDPIRVEARVREGDGETRHRVTLSRADHARLGGGASAEETVEATLRFLLDREPKEAILASFDVSVVSRYFPEFERELANYLPGPRPPSPAGGTS